MIHFDVEKINQALQDFNNATGIRIDLISADFTPITCCEYESNRYCNLVQSCPKGKNHCAKSDQILLRDCQKSCKTEMHICHAGLLDIAVPIIYMDEIVGYLLLGQMRSSADFASVATYLESLGVDTEIAIAQFNKLPLIEHERIQSVSNIAVMLFKYILLENMFRPDMSENLHRAVCYIHANLHTEMTVKSIAVGIGVSKSVLYKCFHETFQCTLGEYINQQRIDQSIKYLCNTQLSIDEISQQVGFSSASYFSKMFKKKMGIPPLKYRMLRNRDS